MNLMFPLWFVFLGGSLQCWVVFIFLVRTLKVFNLVLKMKSTAFIKLGNFNDDLNDNLLVGTLPSEN
jgi:hypothetical protein